jgi:hypothetical protein
MQLTGKIVQLLPLQSGTGKNGVWKKQDFILEVPGNYPKKVCLSVWGDKIDESKIREGNQLTVDFDIESREYNGRWYTDLKAWKLEIAGASSGGGGNAEVPLPSEEPPFAGGDEGNDNLPF